MRLRECCPKTMLEAETIAIRFETHKIVDQGRVAPVNDISEIDREYGVAVYQKYVTILGELIIFEPWRENYHFFQPS